MPKRTSKPEKDEPKAVEKPKKKVPTKTAKRAAKKRPSDVNSLAMAIVAMATGENDDDSPEAAKDQEDLAHAAAVALGRRGGLVGGRARAAALTKKQRSDIAKKAAKARWSTDKDR